MLTTRTLQWRQLAQAAADDVGVPLELVLGVIQAESAGRPEAVSPVGARGLMQLMPPTAAELGVADAFDPAQNIRGGATYLARLARSLDGDWAATLAAYNAGEGRLRRRGGWPAGGWLLRMPAETRAYVPKVLSFAGWSLRGETAVPPRGRGVPPTPRGKGPTLPPVAVVAALGALALALALS